ncbi:MAG: hypothetical protein ACLQDV_16735 [Candidatus Binataceae bacterium]
MTPYTSLAAYLEHWRALMSERAKSPSSSGSQLLDQIDRTIEEIVGADARYLLGDPADSAARRHRDRAELKLRRELLARGVVAG